MLLHSFYSFLANLFYVSEVSDDIHQGIAAGTPLVFFFGAHVFTDGSLFFSLVSFAALRMTFVFFLGIVLFGSCEHSASAVFAPSFLFVLRFVYLFRTSLS